MSWWVVASAFAQNVGDFTIDPAIVLEAGSGYLANGVGAPGVVYDPVRDRLIMAFEVRLTEPDASCPEGQWGIGWASSEDGLSWTPAAELLYAPTAGSFERCVAAHPGVFWDPRVNNGELVILYKAEQGTDACASSTPSWGCEQYVGIGRLRVRFNDDGSVRNVVRNAGPALAVGGNFGHPKVVELEGRYRVLYSQRPNVYMSNSASLSSLKAPIGIGLAPGSVTWALDELFNPAVVCINDEFFPLAAYVGGRTLNASGQIADAGWGKAIGDGVGWLLGVAAYYRWSGQTEWRHWDVLRVGETDYAVWFSEKDSAGRPRVRLATTMVDPWIPSDVYDRACP